jgi:glyoxylase I family protein
VRTVAFSPGPDEPNARETFRTEATAVKIAKSAPVRVSAIDHIYIAVSDLKRSERFYDRLMGLLDFRKGTNPIEGEPHLHYYNRDVRISLRPARGDRPHDPYEPGLHHLCLRVPTRAAVDAAARGLRKLKIEVTRPRLYPQYAPDYYAIFFRDPDGIRLEIVNHLEVRREIRRRWSALTEFVNPLQKLRERRESAR